MGTSMLHLTNLTHLLSVDLGGSGLWTTSSSLDAAYSSYLP